MSLYYNLKLLNTTNTSIPIRFDQQLNIPFIQNPNDWDVSIIRFDLPNFETPIMSFDTSILYNMTMTYNGHSVTQSLTYVKRTSITNDTFIYDIFQMMEMLNNQIGLLYTALNGIITLPTSDMPFFEYNPVTQLISITGLTANFASSLTLPITLSFDNALMTWLYGMPFYGTLPDSNNTPQLYTILFIDYKINTVNTNYLKMTQQAPSFDNYSSGLSSVVITTNLPIQNEFIGGSTVMPIIQDFVPSDKTVTTYYNRIVYNAIVPYRQVSLVSNSAFYNIKMDCYTASIGLNIEKQPDIIYTPMYVPSGGNASIKLMFTKKSHNKYA